MRSNPFSNYTYSYGGWGSNTDPWTNTGTISHNNLLTRAGNATPIACKSGYLKSKPGYFINAFFLKSLHQSNDSYDDLLLNNRLYYTGIDKDYIEIPSGTEYVCITCFKSDRSEEFTQTEINSLYCMVFEYIPQHRTYSLDGSVAISEFDNNIYIKNIRESFPDYNDDQLLEEAIRQANCSGLIDGRNIKIVWDGRDIRFSGVTHECKGFGGIDFNGARIYMPNYETEEYENILLNILPDSSSDITVNASEILETYTTAQALKNKVFTINRNYSGNADMMFGQRTGFDTIIYHTPTIMTDENGDFASSSLYLTPNSGDVPCYNVHDYPEVTFEISNGVIYSNEGTNASYFVACERSNVHIHNFVLKQRSSTQATHGRAVFQIRYCCGVEVDHISGTNPFTKGVHSGYFLGLSSVTNAYVHDCYVGDYTSWGVIGSNHIINTVFERCALNRWDCHYAQHGFNVIKNCVLNAMVFGAGHGTLTVEDSTFINPSGNVYINARGDNVGVFDGDIVVSRCSFVGGISRNTPVNCVVFGETITSETPSNTKVIKEPMKNRIFENCSFPEGISAIFIVGASVNKDKHYFQNLKYSVKDSEIDCANGIIIPVTASQTISEVSLDGCAVSDCYAVKDITCNLKVSNCELVTVKTNATIPRFIAVGNVFSGSQSVSNFTAYALAGNIASDMASVNKHS